MTTIEECKHCKQVISQLGNVWYDQGVVLRDICMLNPVEHRHEPEDEEEIKDQIFLTSNEYEDSKHAT